MEITIATAGVIALITAIIQLVKGVGLPSKYAPLGAVALGVLYFVTTTDVVAVSTVIDGIATGLASVGLYSVGGKEVLNTLSGGKK